MEKRHIAVWIGLVLNLIFLGIISYIPSALEPYRDQLDYQMQQMIEVLKSKNWELQYQRATE